jgi:hypothetical protein
MKVPVRERFRDPVISPERLSVNGGTSEPRLSNLEAGQ